MADEAAAEGREADVSSRRSGRRRADVLTLLFLALFVVLLAITFPDGRATRFQGVPANATADEATPSLGLSDPRRYLEAGQDLGVEKALPTGRRFILNLWPPGMPGFYAVLFAIFGREMPVGLVVGTVMALLWAGVLTLWADLLARYLPVWSVALVIATVAVSDVSRGWYFGNGMFWSEGLYTWTMLLALYAAVRLAIASTRRARLGWAAGVGVALGASAYVRTTSELLARVLTALVIVWAAGALAHRGARRLLTRRGPTSKPLRSWNEHLLALVLCMVAFHAVTVPWRIVAAERLRPDDYAWSTATNLYWHVQWMPDRLLREYGNEWMIAGGGNTACKVDRELCRRIAKVEYNYSGDGYYSEAQYRKFAIETFTEHPFAWTQRRLDLLPRFWFVATVGAGSSTHELLQNSLLLVVLAAVLALAIVRVRRAGPDLLALFIPALLVVVAAPSIVLQWEARYLYPLKTLSVVALAGLLAVELRDRRTNASEVPEPSSDPVIEPATA